MLVFISDFFQNIILLMALVFCFSFLFSSHFFDSFWKRLISGSIFGLMAIIGMLSPLHFSEGIIFDGRSVIIALAGLFGGPTVGMVAAMIAAMIAALFRLQLGGVGAWLGASVCLMSGTIGSLFYYLVLWKKIQITKTILLALGFSVHIVMLASMFFLPHPISIDVIKSVSLPILMFFPLATLIFGLLLNNSIRNKQARDHLEEEVTLRTAELNAVLKKTEQRMNHLSLLYHLSKLTQRIELEEDQLALELAHQLSITFPEKQAFKACLELNDKKYCTAPGHDVKSKHSFPILVDAVQKGTITLSTQEATDSIETSDEYHTLQAVSILISQYFQRKKNQTDLIKAQQKSETANLAKSRFLANMSHEIRTPMNAILGFGQLLEEYLETPKLKEYARAINISGESLLKLINEILDISKIEAGKLEIYPETTNVHVLIKEIKNMFSLAMQQKGLRFEVICPAEFPENLKLDPFRFKQILTNLIGNALKFTAEGSVRLSAHYQLMNKGCYNLTFQIQDTGRGIPENKQQQIFEAFEQNNDASDEYQRGTGLGLTISQQLIHLMQGTIELTSKPGEGTTFTISLFDIPVGLQAHEEKLIQNNLKDLHFLPAKLLLVDDIPYNLTLLSEFLEHYPFELSTAQSGAEALESVKASLPNLILLDIKMPVMNGYEVLKALRSNPLTKTIPVVALTAYSLNADKKEILAAGFNDYLAKPIKRDELMQGLAQYLPQKKPGSIEPSQSGKVASQTDQIKALQKIKDHQLPQWHMLRNSVITNEIESFAQEILEQAGENQLKQLELFAHTLLEQSQAFALGQVQLTMASFEDVLRSQEAQIAI